MGASPIASELSVRSNGQIRHWIDGNDADLHVSTMDAHGRLPLRGPALRMGWSPGQDLALVVRDGVLRLFPPIQPAQPGSGVTVVLDSRWRLLLPYGIRIHSGLEFGIRLIVLAAPMEGLAAALPVSRVVSAFGGRS
jgi:hypothetical protein